jgi:hypothetical protein
MFSLFSSKPKPVTYSQLINEQKTFKAVGSALSTISSVASFVGLSSLSLVASVTTKFLSKPEAYDAEIEMLSEKQKDTNEHDLFFAISDIEEFENIAVVKEVSTGIFVDTSTGLPVTGANARIISNRFDAEALVVPAGKDSAMKKIAGYQAVQAYEEVMQVQKADVIRDQLVSETALPAYSAEDVRAAISKQYDLAELDGLAEVAKTSGYDAALGIFIKNHDQEGGAYWKNLCSVKAQKAGDRELAGNFDKLLAMHKVLTELETPEADVDFLELSTASFIGNDLPFCDDAPEIILVGDIEGF